MTGKGTTRGTSSPLFAPRTMAAASPPERVQIDDGAFVVLAVTGRATDIITGLAVSLQTTVLPVTVISASMWIAYSVGGGLCGVAVVAAALLSMDGIVVAIDSYGPITDNAGGIARCGASLRHDRAALFAPDRSVTTLGPGGVTPFLRLRFSASTPITQRRATAVPLASSSASHLGH